MSSINQVPPVAQGDLQHLFSAARKMHLAGQFPMARFAFESCLRTATNPVMRISIHNYLGQCIYAMGNRELATSHFEAAVKIDDNSEEGMLLTAFCLSWLKRQNEALALANKVLKGNPSCEKAVFLLIQIYESHGNEEKALEMKNKLVEMHLKKEEELAQIARSVLPNNVTYTSMDPYLVPASDTEKVKEVLLKNGFFDLSLGQFDEALSEFLELLEKVPSHKEAMFGAACCLSELKKSNEALVYLEKALAIDPSYQDAKKLKEKLEMNK